MTWDEAFDAGTKAETAIEAALSDLMEDGIVFGVYKGAYVAGDSNDWRPTIGIDISPTTSKATIRDITLRVSGHRLPELIINIFPRNPL